MADVDTMLKLFIRSPLKAFLQHLPISELSDRYVLKLRIGEGGPLDFEVSRHLLQESAITQQVYIGGRKSVHFLKTL